jgi:hypothetical protein
VGRFEVAFSMLYEHHAVGKYQRAKVVIRKRKVGEWAGKDLLRPGEAYRDGPAPWLYC